MIQQFKGLIKFFLLGINNSQSQIGFKREEGERREREVGGLMVRRGERRTLGVEEGGQGGDGVRPDRPIKRRSKS